jgi:lactoylglutathione lyase
MSPGPGFVIADMNLPLKRVNVISLFAEDLAGTRSFYQEVPGLSLTFEDETAAAFKLENMMSA